MTPLDRAHAAMEAAPEDDRARLAFYEAVAAAELLVPLDPPDPSQSLRPTVFDTGDLRLALAFDDVERLEAFAPGADHAALPGRGLIAALAGRGLALGLNLGVAPSSFLMPAEAVDWLAGVLAETPAAVTDRPDSIAPPTLPPPLLQSLDRRLARARGLARHALIAAARWPDGHASHLVAIIDPAPGAEPALAQAVSEALIFSGLEDQRLDIAFLAAADPLATRLARQALRIDLPVPESDAPGTNPDKPPRLR